MDHNPYTPPQANTELTFQQEAAPRPISVWLLIFTLLAFVLAFVVAAARLAGAIISRWADIQSIGLVLVTLAWQLFLVAVFGAAAYALYNRRTWSKWFGLALFVLLAVVSIFKTDTTEYASDAERAGGQLGRFVLMPVLLIWWTYALAFSKKARRYFSKTSSEAVQQP